MSSAQDERYAFAAQEDRSATRAKLSIPASFRASGAKSFQTVVRDLSLSGFSATAINRVAPGTICWLTLPGVEAIPSRVVWWEGGLVGCSFERLMTPAEHDSVVARWGGEQVYRG